MLSVLRYGELSEVTCPKPVIVTQQTGLPNNGNAIIRFKDKRDLDAAQKDIAEGIVIFHGKTVHADVVPPRFWPSEKTRRYY